MTRSPKLYLHDIDKAITDIQAFTQGMTEETFIGSDRDFYAVLKCLEIIGEATTGLSEEFKKTHQDVPWQDIKDFRNILIHEYFEVDAGVVWEVVKTDIPPLKKSIRALLEDQD